MSWIRPAGWIALALATVAIAATPDLVRLPEPKDAIVVDRATLVAGSGPGEEVSLPHALYPFGGTPHSVRYQTTVLLPAVPVEGLSLYIPQFNRRILLEINGEAFYDSVFHTLWTGPMVSATALVRLPQRVLVAGSNRLTVAVEADRFTVPTYLSRLYVGSDAALAPSFKWRSFLDDDVKTMSLAAQGLLGAGLILAYFFRPRDRMLAWLAAFGAVGLLVRAGMFLGFQPAMRDFLPYSAALVPAYGLLCLGVALVTVGVPLPKSLRGIIVAVTCGLMVCAAIDTPLARTVLAVSAIAGLCGGIAAAAGVIGWSAVWRRNIDARIMLGPALLIAWFLLRDAFVAATLPDHPFRLFSPHIGLVFVAALIAVLMRRMASSFDQLDRSNETLNLKLAEREAELAVLARQERVEATRQVREQERQRLTHDLHDGISGHLASIIALSERAEIKPIEQAARDALNDLRLVIYSLDLGDSELPLALAHFRERLIPQLHRLGVELDWSMANLPEVSGVTPGNALSVLRIVQEAITNALKHGPARRIAIRGSTSADGMAAIAIENDGRPFVAAGGGRGLDNMRRRAEQLHAKLRFETRAQGMQVTLLLPLRLPDVETPGR